MTYKGNKMGMLAQLVLTADNKVTEEAIIASQLCGIDCDDLIPQ